jgi:hypothetical protein
MEKSNKLKLWESVEKTDPKYTKKANVKGNKITSIAPQYQILNATRQFGPYGESWGFKDMKIGYELKELGLATFKANFYYPTGEFEIINSVSLFMDNAKTKVDDNFAKKLETDTLTKALSKLGFNADIFLGKFDNDRYLDQLKEEFPLPVEPPTEFELALEEFSKAKSTKELLSIWSKHKKYQNQPLIIAAKNKAKRILSLDNAIEPLFQRDLNAVEERTLKQRNIK